VSQDLINTVRRLQEVERDRIGKQSCDMNAQVIYLSSVGLFWEPPKIQGEQPTRKAAQDAQISRVVREERGGWVVFFFFLLKRRIQPTRLNKRNRGSRVSKEIALR